MDLTLGQQLVELRRHINQLELEFARLSSQFAATHDPTDPDEVLTPVQFMREECRMTSHAATSALNIGEFQAKLTQSTAALLGGEIGFAHLGWMASTASRLDNSKTSLAKFDETKLLRHAKRLGVLGFRRKCEQLLHIADHEEFVHEQVDGVQSRRLHFTSYEDGFMAVKGYLDPEGGYLVRSVLDPLAHLQGDDDARDLAQRRADALVEICSQALDSGMAPAQGGQRPHIHVTTTLETLLDYAGAPAAEMENGVMISGTTIQRLACDATMVRVLLNSESQVIDVGRAQRVVPPATRRTLSVRDKGCVWPGCDRSANFTQAHHIAHWADGGFTDMSNLVSLCRRHHWMVHEGGYFLVRNEDHEIATFKPLPGLYPTGKFHDGECYAGRDPTANFV